MSRGRDTPPEVCSRVKSLPLCLRVSYFIERVPTCRSFLSFPLNLVVEVSDMEIVDVVCRRTRGSGGGSWRALGLGVRVSQSRTGPFPGRPTREWRLGGLWSSRGPGQTVGIGIRPPLFLTPPPSSLSGVGNRRPHTAVVSHPPPLCL